MLIDLLLQVHLQTLDAFLDVIDAIFLLRGVRLRIGPALVDGRHLIHRLAGYLLLRELFRRLVAERVIRVILLLGAGVALPRGDFFGDFAVVGRRLVDVVVLEV
jgi:hypothetical protein